MPPPPAPPALPRPLRSAQRARRRSRLRVRRRGPPPPPRREISPTFSSEAAVTARASRKDAECALPGAEGARSGEDLDDAEQGRAIGARSSTHCSSSASRSEGSAAFCTRAAAVPKHFFPRGCARQAHGRRNPRGRNRPRDALPRDECAHGERERRERRPWREGLPVARLPESRHGGGPSVSEMRLRRL